MLCPENSETSKKKTLPKSLERSGEWKSRQVVLSKTMKVFAQNNTDGETFQPKLIRSMLTVSVNIYPFGNARLQCYCLFVYYFIRWILSLLLSFLFSFFSFSFVVLSWKLFSFFFSLNYLHICWSVHIFSSYHSFIYVWDVWYFRLLCMCRLSHFFYLFVFFYFFCSLFLILRAVSVYYSGLECVFTLLWTMRSSYHIFNQKLWNWIVNGNTPTMVYYVRIHTWEFFVVY